MVGYGKPTGELGQESGLIKTKYFFIRRRQRLKIKYPSLDILQV